MQQKMLSMNLILPRLIDLGFVRTDERAFMYTGHFVNGTVCGKKIFQLTINIAENKFSGMLDSGDVFSSLNNALFAKRKWYMELYSIMFGDSSQDIKEGIILQSYEKKGRK